MAVRDRTQWPAPDTQSLHMKQSAKGDIFVALHQRPGIFVMPNPWDAGSARMLAEQGFEALATSSSAAAGVIGRHDGEINRDEALAHARNIVQATDLPVSADLENGFGDAPETVAETIRMAAAAGLVGCSIEDYSGNKSDSIYELSIATQRVAAAVQAARALPFAFTVTARAENFLHDRPDLDDTIRRLQAYAQAGADVLFAPGLPDLDAVRAVCSAVSKPVNFMVAIRGKSFSVAQLESAGVRRISLASSLYRAAMRRVLAAAVEVRQHGTFDYLNQ